LQRNLASVENLKEWNGLISTNIALGRELIVAKDEIAITTNVAVSAFKLKHLKRAGKLLCQKGDSL
jgi:membrane-bound lytic murein transglycosylase D